MTTDSIWNSDSYDEPTNSPNRVTSSEACNRFEVTRFSSFQSNKDVLIGSQTIPRQSQRSGRADSSQTPYSNSDERNDERLMGSAFTTTLENSTYIDAEDSDFQRQAGKATIEKYRKLELYNRGTHNGKWTRDQTQRHDQDDWYFCDALTQQMGLSKTARLLTWRVFKSLDMRTFRSIEPGTPNETMKQYLVAFCVGAHVYNHLHPEYEWTDGAWNYHPARNCAPKTKRYLRADGRYRAELKGDDGDRHRTIEKCADQLGFPDSDLLSCFEKVRYELPAWVHGD